MQSFDKKRFPCTAFRAILFAKGFSLLSGLGVLSRRDSRVLFWRLPNRNFFRLQRASTPAGEAYFACSQSSKGAKRLFGFADFLSLRHFATTAARLAGSSPWFALQCSFATLIEITLGGRGLKITQSQRTPRAAACRRDIFINYGHRCCRKFFWKHSARNNPVVFIAVPASKRRSYSFRTDFRSDRCRGFQHRLGHTRPLRRTNPRRRKQGKSGRGNPVE